MNKLLLVRHGETAWNASKVLQGQADIPLSEQGRAQAQQLAPLVAYWAPCSAHASDLLRARQTAELLGWPQAAIDPRWREADLGEWTSRPVKDLLICDSKRYRSWRDGLESPPGGESMEQLRTRVAAALASLHEGHSGNVLLVTHGGVIRAVLALTLGLTAERIVAVDPGSLTILDMRETPRLLAYNHVPVGLQAQSTD